VTRLLRAWSETIRELSLRIERRLGTTDDEDTGLAQRRWDELRRQANAERGRP
jgi:hypothetical protein